MDLILSISNFLLYPSVERALRIVLLSWTISRRSGKKQERPKLSTPQPRCTSSKQQHRYCRRCREKSLVCTDMSSASPYSRDDIIDRFSFPVLHKSTLCFIYLRLCVSTVAHHSPRTPLLVTESSQPLILLQFASVGRATDTHKPASFKTESLRDCRLTNNLPWLRVSWSGDART